jgi:hypothetical protein
MQANTPHDHLLRGEKIVSTNNQYELEMQLDGNLVLFQISPISRKALWSTYTGGLNTYQAKIQTDGHLVVYGADNHVYWASSHYRPGTNTSYFLIMQDDGNLVIYPDSNMVEGTAIWSIIDDADYVDWLG